MIIPNLFLIGTPKAGTTSIHENLSMVDTVFMSKNKEPHFFSNIGSNVPTVKSVNKLEYDELFMHVPQNTLFVGESSVSYMHDFSALKRIAQHNLNAKILIMLRSPVRRMYSHWLMDYREGITKKPFKQSVLDDCKSEIKGFGYSHMYVECSRYAESVSECYRLFGQENVFVGFFEDYSENPDVFMDKLLVWLGVYSNWKRGLAANSNPAAEPKNIIIKFLFHNFLLRKLLKELLPETTRNKIRSKVLKPAEKKSISAEDSDFFTPWFEQDVKAISQLVEWDYRRWGYEF